MFKVGLVSSRVTLDILENVPRIYIVSVPRVGLVIRMFTIIYFVTVPRVGLFISKVLP